jgi:hypothetical protein
MNYLFFIFLLGRNLLPPDGGSPSQRQAYQRLTPWVRKALPCLMVGYNHLTVALNRGF